MSDEPSRCTTWLRGIVFLEHLEGISERVPEHLEAAIEYVFQRVAIRFVHVHPGAFFGIIDSGLRLSDESTAKCSTREQPPELYAKEQKEAEDVTREIFVLLDSAAQSGSSAGIKSRRFQGRPRSLCAAVRAVHGCGLCVQYLSKLSRAALGHQQPGQASFAQSGSNCETASVGA